MHNLQSVDLNGATVLQLLEELHSRGGSFSFIAEACQLVLKKSEDYNRDALEKGGTDSAKRDVYFPFYHFSYAQMIHTKAQRLNSLVLRLAEGKAPNFESTEDTLKDLINYASFYGERLQRNKEEKS